MKRFIIIIFTVICFSIISSYANEWECSKCKTLNQAEWNFCHKCGTPKPKLEPKTESEIKLQPIIQEIPTIEQQKIECLKCNHIYPQNLKYCPVCNVQNYSYSETSAVIPIKESISPIIKEEPVRKSIIKLKRPSDKILFKDINRSNYLLISTFCPGLGQFMLDKKFKGISFAILSYGSILYGYHNKLQADKNYKNIRGINLTKDNYNEYYYYSDKVNDYDKKSNRFYTIGAIIWIYNLFDTNYTFNEYKLKQRRLQIQFTGSSAGISKNF